MSMSIQSLLGVAREVSTNSKCCSMKVGSVLIKDGHIISTGINGTPKGYSNCNEVFKERCPEHSEWSEKYEIHAEMNAMLFCPVDLSGSVMVTTASPCWNCTKHMVSAGVKEIWFGDRYYRMTDDEYSNVQEFCRRMEVKFGQIQNT